MSLDAYVCWGRTTTFMTARPHRDTAKIDYHLFHRKERTSGSEMPVGNMSDEELQKQLRRQLEENEQLKKQAREMALHLQLDKQQLEKKK